MKGNAVITMAVSYTHLDVYKRQLLKVKKIFTMIIKKKNRVTLNTYEEEKG